MHFATTIGLFRFSIEFLGKLINYEMV